MRHLFNDETWEFTAKVFCDLGKNILTVGVASYFFKDLPLPLRVVFAILGVGFIIYSIYMILRKTHPLYH